MPVFLTDAHSCPVPLPTKISLFVVRSPRSKFSIRFDMSASIAIMPKHSPVMSLNTGVATIRLVPRDSPERGSLASFTSPGSKAVTCFIRLSVSVECNRLLGTTRINDGSDGLR